MLITLDATPIAATAAAGNSLIIRDRCRFDTRFFGIVGTKKSFEVRRGVP